MSPASNCANAIAWIYQNSCTYNLKEALNSRLQRLDGLRVNLLAVAWLRDELHRPRPDGKGDLGVEVRRYSTAESLKA